MVLGFWRRWSTPFWLSQLSQRFAGAEEDGGTLLPLGNNEDGVRVEVGPSIRDGGPKLFGDGGIKTENLLSEKASA